MRTTFSERPLLVIATTLLLSGCQQPGANLQSNVYTAGQVNQVQDAKVVNILAVMPAKVLAFDGPDIS